MEAKKYFVVYELNRVMGSEKHLALEKVEFNGFVSNSFGTEEQAVQALKNSGMTTLSYHNLL
jgi:hypothetical protein